MAGAPLGTGLSTTLVVCFWVAAGTAALSAALYLFVVTRLGAFREEYDRYLDGLASLVRLDDAASDVNAALTAAGLAYVLLLFTLVALAITMIMWTAQAHRASMSLHPGHRNWGGAWAVGGWFIPVANLVIPKLVLDETERIAKAPRNDRHVDAGWREGSTSAIGWYWWILWIFGAVLSFVGMFLWFSGLAGEPFDRYLVYDASNDLRQVQLGYLIFGVSLAVYAASLAVGAVYVRNVSRLLAAPLFPGDPRFPGDRQSPGDPWLVGDDSVRVPESGRG